jgi:hypothetical protein
MHHLDCNVQRSIIAGSLLPGTLIKRAGLGSCFGIFYDKTMIRHETIDNSLKPVCLMNASCILMFYIHFILFYFISYNLSVH